jgi:hypothetical protein
MAARIGLILLVTGLLGLGLLTTQGGSAPRAPAWTCAATSTGTTNVGSITTIVSTEVKVDSSSAYSGKVLHNLHTVCTNSSGQVKYKLTKTKTTYCNTGTPPHSSKGKLYPSSDAIISWVAGWFWCNAAGKASVKYTSSNTTMKASDPLFGVFIGRNRSTTAKVAFGFLDVSGRSKRGIIVGPGQQVAVQFGSNPGQVVPARLTDGDRTTIADLQLVFPPPNFGRPPAGSSSVLARIYSRGTIRVGFDYGRAKDPNATTFAKAYFLELAKNWKLKLSFLRVSSSAIPAALESGKIDVAVSPTIPSPNLYVLPFFADKLAVLWRIELVQDADWNNGLRSYELATLNSGRYAATYVNVFSTQPPYEPLRPLLFG